MVKLGQPAVDLLKRLYEHSDRDITVLKELLSGTPRHVFNTVNLSGPEYRANGTYYNALQNFKKSFMKEGVLEQRVVEYCNENNPPAAAPDTAGDQAPPAADPSLNESEAAVAGGAPTAAAAGDDAANVSHGAGAGRTGDGPSHEDMMNAINLKAAELKLQGQKDQNNHNQRMNGLQEEFQGRMNQLEVTQRGQQVQINELTVQQMSDRKQNQNQFMHVHERLNGTATKKELESLREQMKEALRRSEGDGMKEDGGEEDGLVGAALDFSDSSSDDESASSPRRAGVNAVTPMDKKTVKVSRETYDAFSSLLNRAVEYGQEGKETEMNACLKKAEDFMVKTDLAEERQRFHQRFKTGSSCARRRFSEYGLKPAAC